MKTLLTDRQSKRLFALGVPTERASESLVNLENDPIDGCEVFTIPDLISLVPKKNLRGTFTIKYKYGAWWDVGSMYPDGTWKHVASNCELIDALYEFILMCIDEKLLKL